MAWPIYLYVPNIIGYLRIAANIYGFCIAFHRPGLFAVLYLISFIGDYLDGRFALWLDQRSTFGAVLDMVTDRLSTTCLLVLLSVLYQKEFVLWIALISLDIGSHWFQMHSSQLAKKISHKDVSDRDNFLMRLYYGNRAFMAYCCIGAEILYLVLFLFYNQRLGPHKSIAEHVAASLEGKPLAVWLKANAMCGLIAAPGWALKQIINLAQLKQSADICVQHDIVQAKTG